MKKILVLGSGALKIGEAGEFDYSGSQAIKALKEEGIKTVLVNPNIATIQTSKFMADEVYFLPVNAYFVEKIIAKERPDGIFLSFGGQTALNCGIDLYKKGIFKKYNLKVLGTPVDSIILTEDRDKFAKHLTKINISIPKSQAASSLKEAKKAALTIGYPVMIRAAFALGGQKSGVAHDECQLEKIVTDALAFSPQVLIEQYLHHFKEIEYEVVRDRDDNCVTVCNMENMDPLGIHTGESIVVAPSQTLTNFEYHFLREKSIEIVRSLRIIGECNVQFALNPKPLDVGDADLRPLQKIDYHVIEVNARLSRSSALASKATGYPLAYVAAKLALGCNLTEIKNQVTKVTQSCFEPALDYLVVKIPRWDLEKFKGVEEKIGSSMKSVGEVMSIGRNFEEALQKAVRMLDIGVEGITDNNLSLTKSEFLEHLKTPTPKRLFILSEAIKQNISIKEIYQLTGIDPWFLQRIKNVVDAERELTRRGRPVCRPEEGQTHESAPTLLHLKQLGFSDKKIGQLIGKSEIETRNLRKKYHILPSVLQIDTLAGEFPAKTNYLYMTYNVNHNDVDSLGNDGIMVLGSGAYRIGSSVEFDWTCVNTALAIKKYNKKSIIINCNPETVSTDYDISDRLYFEELTFERVADIYEFEKSSGVVISVGGQTPNNLAKRLDKYGIKILGTKAIDIDRAEDRNKFSKLLDNLKIEQPYWNKFTTVEDALEFVKKIGYPVLIRPSYVLSGSAMSVCFTESELRAFIKKATVVNKEHPITISKFFRETKEVELDAVAQNGRIKVLAISEHIEHAGVHSGDATIVYPSQKLYQNTILQLTDIAEKLAASLRVTGPFNIQFLAKDNKVYVIEINLRASRTFPFISKVTGVDFAEKIVDSFFGKCKKVNLIPPKYVLVKSAQFSFSRLTGADPILRVEMSSTGEVACFADCVEEAFLKGELSVGARIPTKGVFLSLGGEENKVRFLESAKKLSDLGLQIFSTRRTTEYLMKNGISAKRIYKIQEEKTPNILTCLQKGLIDIAINVPDLQMEKDMTDYYKIRRAMIDHNIYFLANRQKAELFIKAITEKKMDDLQIKAWSEYV